MLGNLSEGTEFVFSVPKLIEKQIHRNVIVCQSLIREDRGLSEQFDQIVFLIVGADILCPAPVHIHLKILFDVIIPLLCREFRGFGIAHTVVASDLLTALIFSPSAVRADIFICPIVRDADLGKHLRELFEDRVRSGPRRLEGDRIGVFVEGGDVVGVPFGTPITAPPVVPIG